MQKQKRLSLEELKAKSKGIEHQLTLEAVRGGYMKASQCHLSPSGGVLVDECTGKPVKYNPDGGW
ncbi:MAG: hypothetical protein IPJ81_06205 [Chitinophagaceae bacterium]|jgi:hypothetical protein|nr:hypothetical protein [Chitinophagaceae bacterium]